MTRASTGDDQPNPNLPKLPRRRGTVACRRCRRFRSKCIHEHPRREPPCEACRLAGPQTASECYFPRRGERDSDRQFRRRPVTDAPAPTTTDQPDQQASPAAAGSGDDRLLSHLRPRSVSLGGEIMPPHDEVVDGCRTFVTSYFQLGFLPKAVFLENLARSPASVSRFLLTCILSISARFTPRLVRRYGSARQATDYFLDLSRCMVPMEIYQPSLDTTQAFFLLAIAQWGNGDRDASQMDMGIAVRMAALLNLHNEGTYALPENASADQIVRSESARRTFWMIQSQENLHSGYQTPAPFSLQDITTLLPCDEADFAFGVIPAERAALAGTPPALANPHLVYSPRRCLFASLVQAHGLWGRVARGASRSSEGGTATDKIPPWDPRSDVQAIIAELDKWEESLPGKHVFSLWNLRGWKSESLHLAYLSVTMVLRLANIVARRIYMDDMLSALVEGRPQTSRTSSSPAAADASVTPPPPDFWATTANELFANVYSLHEQVDAFFTTRAADEGFPQILVFCVYMCGSLASYLWRYPSLCPGLADKAETMAHRSLEALSELQAAWPTTSQWQKGLQQVATPLTGTSPAGGERQLHTLGVRDASAVPAGREAVDEPVVEQQDANNRDSSLEEEEEEEGRPRLPGGLLGELFSALPSGGNGAQGRVGGVSLEEFPNELLDAGLAAFMQGDFHYDLNLIDGWAFHD